MGGNPLYWIDPYGLAPADIAVPGTNTGLDSWYGGLPSWVLKAPGICLALITYTDPYDPNVAKCDENPTQCPLYNENGDDDYTGHGENPEGQTGTGGNWDKHSGKRSGKRYGGNRNKKRGNKNRKYTKPRNPNQPK